MSSETRSSADDPSIPSWLRPERGADGVNRAEVELPAADGRGRSLVLQESPSETILSFVGLGPGRGLDLGGEGGLAKLVANVGMLFTSRGSPTSPR